MGCSPPTDSGSRGHPRRACRTRRLQSRGPSLGLSPAVPLSSRDAGLVPILCGRGGGVERRCSALLFVAVSMNARTPSWGAIMRPRGVWPNRRFKTIWRSFWSRCWPLFPGMSIADFAIAALTATVVQAGWVLWRVCVALISSPGTRFAILRAAAPPDILDRFHHRARRRRRHDRDPRRSPRLDRRGNDGPAAFGHHGLVGVAGQACQGGGGIGGQRFFGMLLCIAFESGGHGRQARTQTSPCLWQASIAVDGGAPVRLGVWLGEPGAACSRHWSSAWSQWALQAA